MKYKLGNFSLDHLSGSLLLAGTIFFGYLYWLDASSFHVLAGDDIRCFSTASKGFTSYYELLVSFFRFRPVTALFIWGSTYLSSADFSRLILIGVGLHTLNGLILWHMLKQVFQLKPIVATGLVLIATFNRFTSYIITPELGVMEGAGITFFLLFLWSLFSLLSTPSKAKVFATGAIFLIIIHLHERYLVLASGCLLVAACIYTRSRTASLLMAGITTGALGLNFFVKKIVLNAPIFMGTTTQPIEFAPRQISDFFSAGVLNLAGVNRGPSYLSGLDYYQSASWVKFVSIACALFAFVVLLIGILSSRRMIHNSSMTTKSFWMTIGVLVVLTMVLVLSASVTFRQEYRWLYPPYLSFLILLGYMTNLQSTPAYDRIVATGLVGFLFLSGPREWAIRDQRDNYYARTAYRTANGLYAILKCTPELLDAKSISIKGDPIRDREWIFMGDQFSTHYGLPTLQFSSAEKQASVAETMSIRYNQSSGNFSVVSTETKRTIESLSRGKLISPSLVPLSTPNGRAAFPFADPRKQGWCITSPARVEIHVPNESSTLSLSLSHVWAAGDGLNISVDAVLPDQNLDSLLLVSVSPLKHENRPEWTAYKIALPKNTSTIMLSIRSESGDQSADWVVFRDFSFD